MYLKTSSNRNESRLIDIKMISTVDARYKLFTLIYKFFSFDTANITVENKSLLRSNLPFQHTLATLLRMNITLKSDKISLSLFLMSH